MEPESASARPGPTRTRPLLLALVGVAIMAAVWLWLGESDAPELASAIQARPQQGAAAGAAAALDPAKLDVEIESLDDERPAPGTSERNPFRFRPKDRPPAPPVTALPQMPDDAEPAVAATPGPPPITVKFLGTLDLPDGTTRALFTDCTGGGRRTSDAREGETVLGQYRLVKLGLQSVVVEHLDGSGRTTLAKNGQECVWKQ